MQKHYSLFCSGAWPFIVLPLVLTTIVLFFNWQRIERDIAQNTQKILDREHVWANVENYNRGRDILLSGYAPSQLAVDKALDSARSTPGVRTVVFVGQVKPILKPAAISILFEAGKIVISGKVNSHNTKISILDSARAKFGKSAVIDQLLVNTTVASAPDISNLLTTASLLGDGTQLIIKGNNLDVRGKVKNIGQRNILASRFAQIFPGLVENNLVVEEDLHLKCVDQLASLLAKENIYFRSGTTQLEADSAGILDKIVEIGSICPETKIQIGGHTDNSGSARTNSEISLKRAQSVVDQLVTRGLNSERFSAIGYGSDNPIQSNDTAAGRTANRRIEIKLNR